jgi:hypothetical protein
MIVDEVESVAKKHIFGWSMRSRRDGRKRTRRAHPDEVVLIVNGRRVTARDILKDKVDGQERNLARKRQSRRSVVRPCYVWVFDNGPVIPYGGTWLYVRTPQKDYRIGRDFHAYNIRERIMSEFPCGGHDDYRCWKRAFLEQHRRPTKKRLEGNALALAWGIFSPAGYLENIFADKADACAFLDKASAE